ncbi:MAG: RES family NAD+ phosphorylase [Deltaproteobacteria bacterium]|nr:RES family NAD+ phosphorylase [Deltaproteobacteria bacterium]
MNEPANPKAARRIDLISYHADVFRNFATLHPTQELTNDLAANPRDQEILKCFFYQGGEGQIRSKVERVLRKSERQIVQDEISAKFNPQNWYATRYSDGTWGLLYSAEWEITALKEAVFHMRAFYREELLKKEVTVDRCVVCLGLNSNSCADLTGDTTLERDKLISKDKSGYPYCQSLAQKLTGQGAELLRTPSARDSGGVCVPIFKRGVIHKDHGPMKYLKCVLSKEGTRIFGEDQWVPLEPDG